MITKDVMALVTSKEHAAEIMQSLKRRLDKYKERNGHEAIGRAFNVTVRDAFVVNEVDLKEVPELNATLANSLVGALEKKSKVPFLD